MSKTNTSASTSTTPTIKNPLTLRGEIYDYPNQAISVLILNNDLVGKYNDTVLVSPIRQNPGTLKQWQVDIGSNEYVDCSLIITVSKNNLGAKQGRSLSQVEMDVIAKGHRKLYDILIN